MAGERLTLLLEYRGHVVDLPAALERLQGRLESNGLAPGTTVATTGGDRLLDLLLLLLLPEAGCSLVILDPALPEARRRQLLELAGATLVLGRGGEVTLREARPGAGSPYSASNGGFRLLLATSGTTAEPRLVELDSGNLVASARAANGLLGLAPGDRWLACLPTHHVGGVSILYRCLLAGAGLVLQERFDAAALLERLESGSITHLSLVPAMLHRLLEEAPGLVPPATLRVVLLGGSPASALLVQQALDLGWPLCPSYGLTEAASQVATLYPPPRRWEAGLVGRPLSHVELRLDGEGRILLRGESLARYCLDEAGRRPLPDERGWFTTSDLGRLDGEGRLWVLGRRDDLVITGGEKVHPAVVEAELESCPGLREVAVVGVNDVRWGERLVACYSGDLSPAELESWARGRLRGAHRPRDFIELDELPRNSLGKLLRRQLRQLAEARLQLSSGR